MCGDFIRGSPKTWRFQLTEEEAAFLPEKNVKTKLSQTSDCVKDMIQFINDIMEIEIVLGK